MRRTWFVVRWSCLALLVMAGVFPATSRAERESTHVAAGAVRFSASSAQAEGAIRPTQHVQVKSLLDGHDIQGSSATLMRRSDGLAVSVHTRSSPPANQLTCSGRSSTVPRHVRTRIH